MARAKHVRGRASGRRPPPLAKLDGLAGVTKFF